MRHINPNEMTVEQARARLAEIRERARQGDYESWDYGEALALEDYIPEERAASERMWAEREEEIRRLREGAGE